MKRDILEWVRNNNLPCGGKGPVDGATNTTAMRQLKIFEAVQQVAYEQSLVFRLA